MLHLRIITPTSRTEDVLKVLDGTVGTAHVAVLAGAARDPQGDLVLCDVAREAADELLADLRGLGLPQDGAIVVESVDLALSDRAEQAKVDAPGEGVDAVVWESLEDATNEEAHLSVTYLSFLTIATMIAACGVMLDNAILIVGAMVVGPEFGPLAGVCTGLVRRASRLVWRSLAALLVGFPVAMLLTWVFSEVMNVLPGSDGTLFSKTLYESKHPVSEFIWNPDLMSVVVAVLAGVAGIMSLTSAKSGALVGVAISVTTVPAAANAALALSYGHYGQSSDSMVQLLVNLGGIVVGGVATLLAQKAFWARKKRRRPAAA
jgi:uncharacterized hydrophobic protein (TIGR00271 family)